MKIGDLIYDYDYGLSGLVTTKSGLYFQVLYEDGHTGTCHEEVINFEVLFRHEKN